MRCHTTFALAIALAAPALAQNADPNTLTAAENGTPMAPFRLPEMAISPLSTAADNPRTGAAPASSLRPTSWPSVSRSLWALVALDWTEFDADAARAFVEMMRIWEAVPVAANGDRANGAAGRN